MAEAAKPLKDDLIEKASYTASLITNSQIIDPLLDTLKRITFRIKSSTQLIRGSSNAAYETEKIHAAQAAAILFDTRFLPYWIRACRGEGNVHGTLLYHKPLGEKE